MKHELLEEISRFYLESNDFNGIPLSQLVKHLDCNDEDLINHIRELVQDGSVGLIFERDSFPFIVRTGFREAGDQLKTLDQTDISSEVVCAYPRPLHLEKIIDQTGFATRPYTLTLAMGEPQMSFRAFDLSVLEFYRNDPRFNYRANDVSGDICISDDHYRKGTMADHDEVFLQTFGFAYDDDMNRSVAVFLRYLHDLSPEHQQIWKAKQLPSGYKLHPEYFASSVLGEYPEYHPIHSAFLAELQIINKMSTAMNRPPLFRDDFADHSGSKTRKFSFLIRPTASEFNDYTLLLDKMLSDNIDVSFFGDEIPKEREIERKDGKIEVQRKGTIQLMDEWVRTVCKINDIEPWEQCIATLKRVRKLRQKPAHAVHSDEFDQKYFHEQRQLIHDAYCLVRTIRMLFANHPNVQWADISIPKWLEEGKILTR